ncbi:hypothetical protein VP01_1249g2 [Puccinia sorghi]|uniref:Uncharacterized protein n=1 Tax=Puccinia sorghi TaxID=27349 RepID=A0A0L6VPF8_9BASI|nr:hypothetical protein VP01_1249g2 [Puccinia sorghi]
MRGTEGSELAAGWIGMRGGGGSSAAATGRMGGERGERQQVGCKGRRERDLEGDRLLTGECTKVRRLKIIPQLGKPLAILLLLYLQLFLIQLDKTPISLSSFKILQSKSVLFLTHILISLAKKSYISFAHPIFLEIIFESPNNVKYNKENEAIHAQGLIFCLEMIITHMSYGHHFMTLILFFLCYFHHENDCDPSISQSKSIRTVKTIIHRTTRSQAFFKSAKATETPLPAVGILSPKHMAVWLSVQNHKMLYTIKLISPLSHSSNHCIIAKGFFLSWSRLNFRGYQLNFIGPRSPKIRLNLCTTYNQHTTGISSVYDQVKRKHLHASAMEIALTIATGDYSHEPEHNFTGFNLSWTVKTYQAIIQWVTFFKLSLSSFKRKKKKKKKKAKDRIENVCPPLNVRCIALASPAEPGGQQFLVLADPRLLSSGIPRGLIINSLRIKYYKKK